jgi:hypothetical protein
MPVTQAAPRLPLGPLRRFGAFGPPYEVVRVARELPDGDKLLVIRLLESGEEAEYKLSAARQDPEAN